MDAPPRSPSPSSPRLCRDTARVSTETPSNPFAVDPNPAVENSSSSSKPLNDEKRKKKILVKELPSSSSCSSCSTQRGKAVAFKRRKLKLRLGPVRKRSEGGEMEAIALPLGMSFAAVVAQVLERKDGAGDRTSVDHLSRICTSAVRESLTNVLGDQFDYFARNFEKSFGSTLRTLRLINDSTSEGPCRLNNLYVSTSHMTCNEASSKSNSNFHYCHPAMDLPSTASQDLLIDPEGVQEQMPADFISKELALHGQNSQLVCASSSTSGSIINRNILSTMEKSFTEQVRSNDLKTLELGLAMKKLKLKEAQLALNHYSNHLGRSKLDMDKSKASFKAEKFKTQVENMRHAELLKDCIDCLVAGIVIMAASLSYAAYVYSYRKIAEATAACTPSNKESNSWWIPNTVSSFNSGLHTLKCQVQVMSRMLFGILMILAIAYLLLQRSATSRQTMPITFILLLFGVACGFAGKLCVDTLGGSGYHWLVCWETFILLHFLSNVRTSALFLILHGGVNVTQEVKVNTTIPYWVRRYLFYSTMLLFLPLVCGLMPFASLGEWKDHFSELILDLYHSSTED